MKDFLLKYKSSIYSLVLLIAIIIVYNYRNNKNDSIENSNNSLLFVSGNTMGTTYNIKYIGTKDLKTQIDSVLVELNNSVSTYIPESEISLFNKKGKLKFQSRFFKTVLLKSKEIYEISDGAFDPTVMPLVNAYGFGYETKNIPDSKQIDSILNFVGFEKIQFNVDSVWTNIPGVQLDFSAIAKGYGVDVVAEFLLKNKISNFMVEIGGEVRCNGKNNEHKIWKIGITNPLNPDDIYRTVELNNNSLATSGNYRNYYEENGVKYSHTINPKTGKVERNELLSASIVTPDCMSADAFATASMVLGPEKAIKMASEHSNFKVFYIYSDNTDLNSFSSLE